MPRKYDCEICPAEEAEAEGGYFHNTDQLCECGNVQSHYRRERA